MSFPIVRLAGTPREQGRRHGAELREAIERNVALYLIRFEAEAGLTHAETLRRAALYGEAIAREAPRYFDEMAGVAEGCGAGLDEIAMLTVRYELLYDRFSRPREERFSPRGGVPDGCTAFAVLPDRSADGRLRLCQNWDWIAGVACALLHRPSEDPATLVFTEAGIPGGKIGINARGLGLAINGLNSTADDWSSRRRPFHVRCDDALRAADLDAAVRAIAGTPRSCSANYLLAQEGRALDLETAPDSVCAFASDGGMLAHTNHFLDPGALDITEPEEELHPRTRERRKRILELLGACATVGDSEIKSFLRDHEGHPDSICRHPNPSLAECERYSTVASVIMDLTALEISICTGPPCEGTFETVRLAS